MDIERIAPPHVRPHLTQSLEEGQRFDVAHRSAHFHQHDFCVERLANQPDALLDFVGDMRDDLDRPPQEVAPPFLGNDFGIDLAGSHVADASQAGVDEALVVAQIQIGFRPVIEHEHFAVLVGAHRARVHIDVGIELLHRDAEPAFLEQQADRGGGHALAHRTHHTAGEEHVARHDFLLKKAVGRFALATSPRIVGVGSSSSV